MHTLSHSVARYVMLGKFVLLHIQPMFATLFTCLAQPSDVAILCFCLKTASHTMLRHFACCQAICGQTHTFAPATTASRISGQCLTVVAGGKES